MIKRILLVSFLLGACSNGSETATPAPATPATCATAWAITKTVVQKNCTKCHDGAKQPSLLPQAIFDASPVRAQLSAGKMPPPPAVLSAGDSASLNDYLNCSGK